jgi:hypothetical protein
LFPSCPQLCLLTLALFETWIVHSLIRNAHPLLGASIDEYMRLALPIGYSFSVVALLLHGYGHPVPGTLVLVFGALSTGMVGVGSVRYQMKLRLARRTAVLDELRMHSSKEPHSQHNSQTVQRVFASFDSDRSGDLNIREVRVMLRSLCPQVTTQQINELCSQHGWNRTSRISFEDVTDALSGWNVIMNPDEEGPQHDGSLSRVLHDSRGQASRCLRGVINATTEVVASTVERSVSMRPVLHT